MKFFAALFLLMPIWLSSPALAQIANNKPIYQSGNVTPGHLGMFATSGVLMDAGAAIGGPPGTTPNTLNITGPNSPFCINDAPTTSLTGYHQLCLGSLSLGGGLISYNAYGGATQLSLNCNINGITAPCIGGTVTGVPSVPSNAALKAASTITQVIYRAGFNSAGDGGAAFYTLSGSPCSQNGGLGDNGWQVVALNGGCWIAQLPSKDIDARLWGQFGTADDEPLAAVIDASMGDSTWPAMVAKSVVFPAGTTFGETFVVTNIHEISGTGKYPVNGVYTFNLGAAGTSSTDLIKYVGTGPFSVHDASFSCPHYSLTAASPTAPNGLYSLLVQPNVSGAATTQVYKVSIKNNSFVGGWGSVFVAQTVSAEIAFNYSEYTFKAGFVVSDFNNSTSVTTASISIHDNVSFANGNAGVVAIGNLDFTGPPPTDWTIYNNVVTLAGWIPTIDEFCYDLTGTAVQEFKSWNNVGIDCGSGGVEFKRTQNTLDPSGVIPNTREGETNINFDYTSHIDLGEIGYDVDFESAGAPAADSRRQFIGSTTVQYLNPPSYTAGWPYAKGQIVQLNGAVFAAFGCTPEPCSGGVTGSASQPFALTENGVLVSGSNIISGLSSTTGLAIGQSVIALDVPVGSTITALGAGQVTISNNAQTSITVPVTFAPPAATDGTVIWRSLWQQPQTVDAIAATMPGASGGSGYATTDVLTATGGTCTAEPTFAPTLAPTGGQIVDYRVITPGYCATPPANPVTLTGGSGTGATANIEWFPLLQFLIAAQTYTISDLDLSVKAMRTAYGIEIKPEGGLDQTVRNMTLHFNGVVQRACIRDVVSTEFGVMAERVDGARLMDFQCRSYGSPVSGNPALFIGTGAVIPAWAGGTDYYPYNLVRNGGNTYIASSCSAGPPCLSANSGGPTGTGSGIADNQVVWNFYGTNTSTFVEWDGLTIDGGVYEVMQSQPVLESAGGIVNGIISGGTRMIGKAGVIIADNGTLNLAIGGGVSLEKADTGNASAIFFESGANGTITLRGNIFVSSAAAIGTFGFKGWGNDSTPSTGSVIGPGLLSRGFATTVPVSTACNFHDSFGKEPPAGTGNMGWVCTTPSNSNGTWTAF